MFEDGFQVMRQVGGMLTGSIHTHVTTDETWQKSAKNDSDIIYQSLAKNMLFYILPH